MKYKPIHISMRKIRMAARNQGTVPNYSIVEAAHRARKAAGITDEMIIEQGRKRFKRFFGDREPVADYETNHLE